MTLNITTLDIRIKCHAEFHYADCRYAVPRYAECRGALKINECYGAIMLSMVRQVGNSAMHCYNYLDCLQNLNMPYLFLTTLKRRYVK
jgi:hypothetical protein